MIDFILENLDFILGYVIGQIVFFIVECLCIASGNSDPDKWTEEDK